MIMLSKRIHTVAGLMEEQQVTVGQLVQHSGVELRIVEAIVHQRYTPSPRQRMRVSRVLGVTREAICWGHAATVESSIKDS